MEFSVVSTFSGCGGSSLGYKMAGGSVRLAVEWDDNAVNTYRLNFPNTKIFHGDIGKLSVAEIQARTGLKEGELDVFDGSPPCQGFSTAGKREFSDNRNQLFREYCRILRGLKPKVFVMENVSGMVKGKMKLIFADILRELKACGYNVRVRLLNAKFFGVPQSRQRMIFLGVREDLGVEPTHPIGKSRIITAEEAIASVQNDPKEIEMLLEMGRVRSAFAEWDQIAPGRKRTDIPGIKTGFSGRKQHPKRPCSTITKTDGNLGMHGIMHWSERRRFSVGEFKRLASFPDEFEFFGDYKDAVERIGNTVPPLFMKGIADHIANVILPQCYAVLSGGTSITEAHILRGS
jgi:DNA (cytosine-5)-methyltransferase 1